MELSVRGLAEFCSGDAELTELFAKLVRTAQELDILFSVRKIAVRGGMSTVKLDKKIEQIRKAIELRRDRLYSSLEKKSCHFPKFEFGEFARHCLPGQEDKKAP